MSMLMRMIVIHICISAFLRVVFILLFYHVYQIEYQKLNLKSPVTNIGPELLDVSSKYWFPIPVRSQIFMIIDIRKLRRAVGIAINAPVAASIVLPDVLAYDASTALSLAFIF